MANLKFEHELSNRILVGDKEWEFSVPSLPSSKSLNSARFIKMITLVTKGNRHRLLLRIEPAPSCRAISDPLDQFLLVSFSEFGPLRRSSAGTDANGGPQPNTNQERSEYMIRFLRAGIDIDGVQYNFYGHSNSQLKSRTCFLYAGSKQSISMKLESMGDFTKIKNVTKKAKRIGLLFSAADVAMNISSDMVKDIPDVKRQGHVFTDGCGLIAPVLARDVARQLGVAFRNRRYTPAVFQIRYLGYKGVVTVDPRMKGPKPSLKMRESMKKFTGGKDASFAVVEYSKVIPHTDLLISKASY
ncbi:hypothetical protein G7Z17_g8547 [Cylindrodendrum hubeiense]|uniref:RNA-dependent RNA polymerase n=1 Tax=Cylindrodendrum hubeiense TaxID=595255 RepID=A0A9P5H5Q2_9HYPO|nr:hypothetical protein G7Z17_g8547 [Cylindrodendrum hubeiense]